jgi:hypothetical protein
MLYIRSRNATWQVKPLREAGKQCGNGLSPPHSSPWLSKRRTHEIADARSDRAGRQKSGPAVSPRPRPGRLESLDGTVRRAARAPP